MARTAPISPLFNRTRDFISKYSFVEDSAALDVVTLWAMGTWTFSPEATNPATYPYLYVAGARGSGKTVLGVDVLGSITRMHTPTVGITGPSVFRIIADVDEETGEVFSIAPTLALDEIDATFSGAKDEPLRQMLNAGYKRGSTVPRAAGKGTINYPVFCPKILMGIDNGHLPDTVTDRSIRIDIRRASPVEMAKIEPFYSFDVEDEAADLSDELAAWARENSHVLRDYRPAAIDGLQPRQWEISRSLVQLASTLGLEDRIRADLFHLFTKNPERPSGKVSLYKVISHLFEDTGEDRITTKMIMQALETAGVSVPGMSGKGLAAVLSEDGISPQPVRMRPGHPGIVEGKPVQRGYHRYQFDGVFVRYLLDDNE